MVRSRRFSEKSPHLHNFIYQRLFYFQATLLLLNSYTAVAAFQSIPSLLSRHRFATPFSEREFSCDGRPVAERCIAGQTITRRSRNFATRMSNQGSETVATYQVKVLRSVDEVSEEDWNQCALDSAGEGKENPFILWAFFKALEDSKSAVREVGWAASHIAVK